VKKQDVLDYYGTPHVQTALLRNFYGDSALTLVKHDEGEPFYRRNLGGEPIKLNNPSQLKRLLDQRTVEFHPSIGKSTNVIWVDIDPGKDVTTHELKPIVKQIDTILKSIPEVTKTSLAFSGGRGFYVRGHLKDDMDTTKARELLSDKLKPMVARDPKFVMAPPQSSQIRLDISTLHDKGSIRGLYSLNHETGLVSIPLKRHELDAFDASKDAKPKKVMGEFAPGIPSSRTTHDLPSLKDVDWTMSVQHHDAVKAGPHWDLRLVDPDTGHAHSWAVPKAKFPEAGGKPLLAVQTPTHTSDYALSFGEGGPKQIHTGYGRGSVEIKHKEKVNILSSGPDSLRFERVDGKEKERYALVRTNKDKWLMRNVTPKVAQFLKHAFDQGYYDMLRKLGADGDPNAAMGSQGAQGQQGGGEQTSSESGRPIPDDDSQLPAGQLAEALGNLDETSADNDPVGSVQGNPVDKHLERESEWGNPFSVGMVAGSSPIIPGGNG
jgi:hypothetical protein